jgi:hypothetical protein
MNDIYTMRENKRVVFPCQGSGGRRDESVQIGKNEIDGRFKVGVRISIAL